MHGLDTVRLAQMMPTVGVLASVLGLEYDLDTYVAVGKLFPKVQ